MNGKNKARGGDRTTHWEETEVDALTLYFLKKMFSCREREGVDATVAYAGYMSHVQLNSDNYPIFITLLEFENHWVVDALLGDNNPEDFLSPVQPNSYILEECFKMFAKWRRGGIYPQSLLVLLGVLRTSYEDPFQGYRLFPINVTDINNLGKHLDEEQDQSYPLNRTILHLLDSIANMADPGSLPVTDKQIDDVATQANNIRGKFLDATKHLNEAIPDELLKKGNYQENEIAPSNTVARK